MDFDNDGYAKCDTCKGRKSIDVSVNINRLCPECNGKSGVDWVTHMMGNHNSDIVNLNYHIAHRNIQRLIEEIKREAMLVGKHVVVSVEERKMEPYEYRIITDFNKLKKEFVKY